MGGDVVSLSLSTRPACLQDEMLANRYLRAPMEFKTLLKDCRRHLRQACPNSDTRADGKEALELLEALYNVCRGREVMW
jgi:hypothetical protein